MYISVHTYIVYVHGGRARLSVRISVDRHKAACTLIALHAPPIDTIPLHADSEAQRGCCAPLFARDYRAQRDERIGTILRFPDFSLDRAIIVLYFSHIVIPVFRGDGKCNSLMNRARISGYLSGWSLLVVYVTFVREEINEKESSWMNWKISR